MSKEDKGQKTVEQLLAELRALANSVNATSDSERKYVGKYLPVEQADALCNLLGIPTGTGGTAIFRAMLAKVLSSK